MDHNGVRNLEDQERRRHRFVGPFHTVLLEEVRRSHRQIMHIRMTETRLSRVAGPAGICRTKLYGAREESPIVPAVVVRLVVEARAQVPVQGIRPQIRQSPQLGNRSCIPIRTLRRRTAALRMPTHHPPPISQFRTKRIRPFALEPPDDLVRRECAPHFRELRLDRC